MGEPVGLSAEEREALTDGLASADAGCWDHEECCWASAEAMFPAVEAILAARLAAVPRDGDPTGLAAGLEAVIADPANRWWHTGGTECIPRRAISALLAAHRAGTGPGGGVT